MRPECKILATAASIAFALPFAASAGHNEAKDVAAIQDVVEKFRTSIIQRDKPTFTGLFFSEKPERVTWQFVVDDARLARVQKTKPEARKPATWPK